MGEASISIAVAGATALLTFLCLYLGLPAVGLAPGATALLVAASVAALWAAGFVITGENLFEHTVKAVILGLMTGVGWAVGTSGAYLFVCATLASALGMVGTALAQSLVRRRKMCATTDEESPA